MVTSKRKKKKKEKERDTYRPTEQNAEFRNRLTQIWTLWGKENSMGVRDSLFNKCC